MTCPSGCCPSYRDHLLSIGVAASAMPTRSPEVARIATKEDQWSRDHAAYRRFRREGLQPRTIDGAANVESKAETKSEVESGIILESRVQRAQVKDILGDDA